MAKGDGTVTVQNARIIFRNFAGREGQYNREGDRNFNLILPRDLAEKMREDGWNVKFPQPTEEGEERDPRIQVSVSFKGGRPPRIIMVTSRGKTELDESRVELLDWVDIREVDLIIRPYTWAVGGRSGIKAYLKAIYITIVEDELERKYADVPEIGFEQPKAIEAPMWEGEVVD